MLESFADVLGGELLERAVVGVEVGAEEAAQQVLHHAGEGVEALVMGSLGGGGGALFMMGTLPHRRAR